VNDEYRAFPFSAHDDMLDCLARIKDEKIHLAFPEYIDTVGSATLAEMARMGLFGKINEYDPLNFQLEATL
jgi:hypothetical protein